MMDLIYVLSVVLSVVLGGIGLLWVLHLRVTWQALGRTGACLPDGSFGVPIFGESIACAVDPIAYYTSHVKKYGRLFKSHLFLRPAVVGTTPEFAKLVLANAKLFASGWPDQTSALLGKNAFIFRDGPELMNIKKVLRKSLLPESLKTQVAPIEAIVLRHLNKWADEKNISARKGAKELTVHLSSYIVLGIEDISALPEGRELAEKFAAVSEALLSLPINFPGFTYYKGLKAKAWMAAYIKRLSLEREGMPNRETGILGAVLASKENLQANSEVQELDDEAIVNSLLTMWFGSFENTSTTMTWVLKFLNDHPEVYRKVKAEQDDILKQKIAAGEDPSLLTWGDIKKMTYSMKFFNELLRLVSIGPFVIRKAVQGVEYEGKLIPKDWKAVSMLNSIHLDPETYPDPLKFDPSRFDTTPKPFTFIPFSFGPHMCPGNDYITMLTLIYIHHLVTGFEFEGTAPDQGIVYDSTANPRGGFPIKIQRKRNVY